MKKRIILASASPRRKELLQLTGYEFEIQASCREEVSYQSAPPEIVKELALSKAEDIAAQNEQKNLIVIGADTVVAHQGAILGKPGSGEEAREMIRSFQGDRHQVYTGVAVLSFDETGGKTAVNYAVETGVWVNPMTDEEICRYVAGDYVLDKAGAYGIQGCFAIHIQRIEGDYFNVVGLPVSSLYETLKKLF